MTTGIPALLLLLLPLALGSWGWGAQGTQRQAPPHTHPTPPPPPMLLSLRGTQGKPAAAGAQTPRQCTHGGSPDRG